MPKAKGIVSGQSNSRTRSRRSWRHPGRQVHRKQTRSN